MKAIIVVVTAFLAVINCSTITKLGVKNEDNEYDIISKQLEGYQKILPKVVEEDAKLLVPQIIEKYGYPCEVHTIVSNDGYVLEMHRIPYGKKGPSENRPAVYLQHGLLLSSADWVIPGPENGFAYLLADAGYDVWMPNVRGNRYSRKHIKFDPDKDAKKFWDFSWHEIALDDLSVMVDYVIDHTRQPKIFFIGHSQGTTILYILCAEKPEYNDKFRAVFSLAPVAYMRWMTSPLLRTMALFEWASEIMAEMIGMYEFSPHREFLAPIGNILCGDNSIMQVLCTNAVFAVCGFNPQQMNASLIPVIMGHTPAGASTKQAFHYAQLVNSGKFRQWDYGYFGNNKHYNSRKPPNYNLKNVKVPIYLHYSMNDWMSNEKDVNRLYKELPNIQGKFLSPDGKFNHIDYLFGIDAPDILYNRVLGLMNRH